MFEHKKRAQTARMTMSRQLVHRGLGALAALSIGTLIAQAALADEQSEGKIIESHGYSFFGDLSYPPDFKHFNYVNPDAPKGGEISIATSGTFDTFNPYALKGVPAALSSMAYESLLTDALANTNWLPADAWGEGYGLLAERLEYDEGKNWVIFHMRPEAQFSDGTPLTAHDVVFSHNLFLEQGIPSYANAVKKRVIGAEALDDLRVKFTFAEDVSRRSLIDQVGSTPVFPKAWYEKTGARLDESRLDAAPGSGPYVLESYDINRNVVYKRNPDYWGWDLPVNKGRHNFDRIRVEYFTDDTAEFEAFKAGEFTFRPETTSRIWATGYDFPAFNDGAVIKKTLPDGLPPSASGMVFNLGRDMFKDKRVRQAFALAYNFEWTNESLQFGLFQQRHSFAQDTVLESKGAPEGAELEFLKSLGDLVPAEMLTEEPLMAHSSSPERLNDRRNLRKAMGLLDEAGWAVGDDGIRRNAAGEPLAVDFPIPAASSPTLGAIVENYAANLEKMGVQIQIDRVDSSQFTKRRRDRDYDMLFAGYYALTGAGTGLRQLFGSESAEYSVFNPAGLASPLVDAIIDAALASTSSEEEDTVMRALDRALRYEFALIPTWYNDSHWVAMWDMYEHPENIAPFDLGYLDYWWFNAEKAEALKASGALR
ncbi:MAG: extracellular solute-binding protein [Pseudomonadota bacterium]